MRSYIIISLAGGKSKIKTPDLEADMAKVLMNYDLDLIGPAVWLTITPGAWARQALVHVQEVGDFPAGSRYFTQREGLDSFLIKYVLDGQGYLEYGGQRYLTGPGSMFWIDCRARQHYGTDPDTGHWHVLWVHFTGANSENYYRQFLRLGGGCPVKQLGPDSSLAASLGALITLYRDGQASAVTDVRASALLTDIMAQAIALPGEACIEPACVRQIRQYLSQQYVRRITLDDLSRLTGLNKFYFQKLFKRYVGLTPNEYLLLTRITQGKRLLRESSRTVSQIARDVGIGSVSHFIRLFREQEKITPNAYRHNWHSH